MKFRVLLESKNLEKVYDIIRDLPKPKYNSLMAEIQRVINEETGKIIPTDQLQKAFKNLGR